MAFQEVGEVTCTLGEVKNRGDLIIYWRCNPVDSDPRHMSRYSLDAPSLFLPRGRADRYCVVVDVEETATSRVADRFIAIKAGREFEALWTLRAWPRVSSSMPRSSNLRPEFPCRPGKS